MVSMETEVVQKKRTVTAREFFSSVFFLSSPLSSRFKVFPPLSLSLCLSRCLHRLLKVKQRAERSISLINTTQQHSALRGEMKRHGGMSTCRPGVVLTNDTYHTSHGWEPGRREERRSATRGEDGGRRITEGQGGGGGGGGGVGVHLHLESGGQRKRRETEAER